MRLGVEVKEEIFSTPGRLADLPARQIAIPHLLQYGEFEIGTVMAEFFRQAVFPVRFMKLDPKSHR